jgi:hypothetical protein
MTPRTHNEFVVLVDVHARISSLEKKPANGGIPEMAIVAIRKVQEGNRQVFSQTAHRADVLFIGHRVDHATGTEEQQCFEERVGHDVEHADAE